MVEGLPSHQLCSSVLVFVRYYFQDDHFCLNLQMDIFTLQPYLEIVSTAGFNLSTPKSNTEKTGKFTKQQLRTMELTCIN